MRSILLDWLVEVAQEFHLNDDTLFLCVSTCFSATILKSENTCASFSRHYYQITLTESISHYFAFAD